MPRLDSRVSDVEPVRRPRADTEVILIDEDDMIEAACVLPHRTAAGTMPPPADADPEEHAVLASPAVPD